MWCAGKILLCVTCMNPYPTIPWFMGIIAPILAEYWRSFRARTPSHNTTTTRHVGAHQRWCVHDACVCSLFCFVCFIAMPRLIMFYLTQTLMLVYFTLFICFNRRDRRKKRGLEGRKHHTEVSLCLSPQLFLVAR